MALGGVKSSKTGIQGMQPQRPAPTKPDSRLRFLYLDCLVPQGAGISCYVTRLGPALPLPQRHFHLTSSQFPPPEVPLPIPQRPEVPGP